MLIGDIAGSAVADKGLCIAEYDVAVGRGKRLHHAVLDLSAALVLIQIGPGMAPFVLDADGHGAAHRGLDRADGLIELHDGDDAVPQAVLIVKVVPDLDDGDIRLGDILVGDHIGGLSLSVGIGDRVNGQIVVISLRDDHDHRDRSSGLDPLAARIGFGDGIVIGTGILVVRIPEADLPGAVDRHAGVLGQRRDDRISFHIVAGGVGAGGDIEDEDLLRICRGAGVQEGLSRADRRRHAKRLDIDLVGFNVKVIGMVILVRKRVGEPIGIAGHFVGPVGFEGRFVRRRGGVEDLRLHGELDHKALAGPDHIAVLGVKFFIEADDQRIAVLLDRIVPRIDGVFHVVRIRDHHDHIRAVVVGMGKGHAEF